MFRRVRIVVNGWAMIGAPALWLASAGAPTLLADRQVSGLEPAYSASSPQADSWTTYKQRLAILALQRGVREATVQANVPGLIVNQGVIDLERTEPLARSSG